MRVISSGKSKDRQHNGQKKTEKQWSTKHYTENERLSKTINIERQIFLTRPKFGPA
jgi:hypothetical protein